MSELTIKVDIKDNDSVRSVVRALQALIPATQEVAQAARQLTAATNSAVEQCETATEIAKDIEVVDAEVVAPTKTTVKEEKPEKFVPNPEQLQKLLDAGMTKRTAKRHLEDIMAKCDGDLDEAVREVTAEVDTIRVIHEIYGTRLAKSFMILTGITADETEEGEPEAQPEPQPEEEQVPETPKNEVEAGADEAQSTTEITLDDLRAIVPTKAKTHRAELKAKLTELGVANVTSLDPSLYAAFYEFVNSL